MYTTTRSARQGDMESLLGTAWLAIGVAAMAFLATTPQNSDAASEVVRSIFVHLNGRADFKSIQAAVDSVPFGNDHWIRIHVAAGVYNEKVVIPAYKSFILLEGEGSSQTSIEWADHAGGECNTSSSPTFASYSSNFMARDISFKNTYDGVKNMAPAVAALVAGDQSSFYRCNFVSVQDTLCDLEGRHYYESCHIEGAVDFIFGNAQSIYQGCQIWTVKAGQEVGQGFITAQGRETAAEETGFVFKGCTVGGVTQAYLGRAWRGYARVIFYQTDMSAIVVGAGWDAWGFKGQEGKLTMAESGCTGPGAKTAGRVPWAKTALGAAELAKFVDISYVSGCGWLAAQPR